MGDRLGAGAHKNTDSLEIKYCVDCGLLFTVRMLRLFLMNEYCTLAFGDVGLGDIVTARPRITWAESGGCGESVEDKENENPKNFNEMPVE